MAIENHDVWVTVQQGLAWRCTKAEQDAPDSRDDLTLGFAYRCGLHFDQGSPGPRCGTGHGHEWVGRQRSGECG
jgi:hypothetical protein